MAVNIIKLCVGADSIADLERWQKQQFRYRKTAMHITRQTPRRAEEVLAGGSLYWVINGFISMRQKLIDLRAIDRNGIPHCALVLDKQLIRVEPRPRQPFQGWRYLEAKDAPRDLIMKDVNMSDKMLRELAELGLV